MEHNVADICNGEPIAIVGFSFKFAGDATSADNFWDLLVNGRCTASKVPANRFNVDAFYHPDTNRLDTLPVKIGNFLKEDIAMFDAPFFSIKATEAAAMDPQSRALLETTYRALENAGIPVETCSGTRTCVFTGISADDYRLMYAKDTDKPIRHAATGMALSMLANKISWFYNFKGPSVQLDTACSASLNALHLACRSLRLGESNMGVVAAANMFFTPESMSPLAHLNFFSPDGKCYSFDHRANGYSRGEGFGVLILKRVTDALRDGDTIRAVIRATGANENGRTPGGITKVNTEAQRTLILDTYNQAGLELDETLYAEAHGPGTEGDYFETLALGSCFNQHRSEIDPLFVGSVKANIGHLEGTSGIASLIKVILMLEHGILPKLANLEQIHPKIAAERHNMKFLTENTPWPEGLRRASINSFGFGGANAHVVIDDAFHFLKLKSLVGNHNTRTNIAIQKPSNLSTNVTEGNDIESRPHLLVWSVADEGGIDRILEAYQQYFLNRGEQHSLITKSLNNFAYTLSERRSTLAWKSFLIARSFDELRKGMAQSISTPIRSLNNPRVAYVFTGQGAQYARMGLDLLQNETFQTSLENSARILRKLGAQWDLIDELSLDETSTRLHEPVFSQSICTALQIALIDTLRKFGVCPSAVVGHSSGEIAAAYCIGAISEYAAIKVAYFRGLLSNHLVHPKHPCGMLAAALSVIDAEGYIKQAVGCDQLRMEIACVNSPKNVTIAGDSRQLDNLKDFLTNKSIFARRLNVSVAYHSQYMKAIAGQYETLLGTLEHGKEVDRFPKMHSSVTGNTVGIEELRSASYWVRNLISPVLFGPTLNNMFATMRSPQTPDGSSQNWILVELGPHSALRAPIRESLQAIPNEIKYIATLIRGKKAYESLLRTTGQLHCLGYKIDFAAVNHYDRVHGQPLCLPNLPEYPFDHSRRYWHESRLSENHRFRKYARNDLLGSRVLDWNPLEARWRNIIRSLENPWIEDHRIGNALIYPGAGMLVMGIEAIAQYIQDFDSRQIRGFRFKDIRFLTSLKVSLLPEGVETQVYLKPIIESSKKPGVGSWFNYHLYVLENQEWIETCRAKISIEIDEDDSSVHLFNELNNKHQEDLRSFHNKLGGCSVSVNVKKIYRGLENMGYNFGPTFQVFDTVRYSPLSNVAAAEIKLKNWTLRGDPKHNTPHFIHPVALDGVLQLPILALGSGVSKTVPTMVPTRIANMWISAQGLGSESNIGKMYAAAGAEYRGYRGTESEVLVVDEQTNTMKISVQGLETIIIDSESVSQLQDKKELFYKIKWLPDTDDLSPEALANYCRESVAKKFLSLQSTGMKTIHIDIAPFSRYIEAAIHKRPCLTLLELASPNAETENDLLLWSILHESDRTDNGWVENFEKYSIMSSDSKSSDQLESRLSHEANDTRVQNIQFVVDESQYTGMNSNPGDDLKFDIITMSPTDEPNHESLNRTLTLLKPSGRLIFFRQSSKDHPELCFDILKGSRKRLKVLSKVSVSTKHRDLGYDMFILGLEMSLNNGSDIAHDVKILTLGLAFPDQLALAHNLAGCMDIGASSRLSIIDLNELSHQVSLTTPLKTSSDFYIILCEYGTGILHTLDSKVFSLLQNVFLSANGIFWVSARDVTKLRTLEQDVATSDIVTGLSRTIRTEISGMKFITITFELDNIFARNAASTSSEVCNTISKVFRATCMSKTLDIEPEYIYRRVSSTQNGLFVPRIRRAHSLNAHIASKIDLNPVVMDRTLSSSHSDLALTMISPGLLDSLVFTVDTDCSKPLAPYEVFIRPHYVGLNFLDLLTALGRVPNASNLGMEAAGIVVAAGSAADLKPGDRVVVLTSGALATKIRAHYQTVIKIPDELSFADAASIPGTACTVYRSFIEVANLQAGESVLIHAGAGATGQMAIQFAKHLGAEIFVTVGSERKKNLICDTYGIPEGNVFYSRDASFAQALRRRTNGQGVDVVLNSLSGEMLERGWEDCVAPFGRWVELGKMDILEGRRLDMRTFLKNISFSCVDLSGIWKDRPAMMRRILRVVFEMVANTTIKPVSPVQVYNIADIESAFRLMQNNPDGGKVIVEMDVDAQVKIQQSVIPSWAFDATKSYVIVGGFGGLGRVAARWMSSRNAKNLILISRHGANDSEKQAFATELDTQGCRIYTFRCDISDYDSLSIALKEAAKNMPEIKGCIQASMVLKDTLFKDMTYEDWISCTAPKVKGSWNLHALLPKKMDFFIFFSSLVGVIGASGQSNYAAGNTFQNALARYRVSIGEKAVSLDLGMMQSEGVIAEDSKLAAALESTGFYQPMSTQELICLLEKYCDPKLEPLAQDDAQVVCGIEVPATLAAKGIKEPDWMKQPLFSTMKNLAAAKSNQTSDKNLVTSLKTQFEAVSSLEAAASIVTGELVQKISKSLAIPISDVDPQRPLHYYGVDSLVAVELRNWFAKELRADVPVFNILGNASSEALGLFAATKSAYIGNLLEKAQV